MITSTICQDEPKFYLNLVNFDVVVYMTHSVNVIKEIKGENLVLDQLDQHTIPYVHVVG